MRRLKYLGGGILAGLILTGLLFGYAPTLMETLSGAYDGWRADRKSGQSTAPRPSGGGTEEESAPPQEVEIDGRVIRTRSSAGSGGSDRSAGGTESVRIDGRTIRTRVGPVSDEEAAGEENLRGQLRRRRRKTYRELPVEPRKVETLLERLDDGLNLGSRQND